MTDAVEKFRKTLAPDVLAMVDALRAAVAAAHPGLVESIKWNAPNFTVDGEDRITLGIERKGGVRLVLHRGATRHADSAAFSFADDRKLARWAAPDRGVIVFGDLAAIRARAADLQALCRSWVEQTR